MSEKGKKGSEDRVPLIWCGTTRSKKDGVSSSEKTEFQEDGS